jgi:DNA-binding transcriptional regulator YdaS (Cro superfamily)
VKQQMHRALKRAVKQAGGLSALAKINKTTPQRVYYWVEHGKKMPAECVLATEKATGVSRHELRPDIYPQEA